MLKELERLGIKPDELRKAASKELQRRKKADTYLNDPFLFHKYTLCDEDKRFCLAAMHEDGLTFISEGRKFKLILWPRGHLKTFIFTQGETIRRALKRPNIRVLLSTAKAKNAQKFLRAIKGHLKKPEFEKLYGELIPATGDKIFKNNEDELTLLNRTELSLREATFTVSSIEKGMTSQHYDLIVHDDLVVRENITTPDQMEKVIQYFKDCMPLLDPGGEVWVIGTRWHPLDLYGWLIENLCDPRCVDNGYVHLKKCTCKLDVTLRTVKENDKYIFPEVMDDEYVDTQLQIMGRYEFACQYYNNPVDPEICWFKESKLKEAEIDSDEIRKLEQDNKLLWYIAVDPAESLSRRASKTAVVAVGVDPATGIWYVDHAEGKRVETPGLLNLCMNAYKRYHPVKFGMEKNTRKGLEYDLKQYMIQVGTHFLIESLDPQKIKGGKGQSKGLRIKRLQPLFEYGKIRVNRNLKDLWTALYTMPNATSWDLVDALSYIMDLLPEGVGQGTATAPRKRYIHWKGLGY